MRCLNCNLDGVPLSAEICPRCGVHLPSLMRDLLPIGSLLRGGTYRIDYALGRGGFGITYRATHQNLEQFVAIKEFYPQEHVVRNTITKGLSIPTTQQEAYERGLQRFLREGRILAKLNHSNVVRVQDLFEEQGTAYLVMELVVGKTLKDELKSQPEGRLPIKRVEEVMEQLVAALEAIHDKEVYHLDLKPDNVLLNANGRVVLVDFGAARQGLSGRSTRAYTETYAAPEVIAGGNIGPESDIFELGMMLHEMLTGKLPEPALRRLMKDTWEPAGLGKPWQSLVMAALQLRPKERPQTMREWWEGKKHSAAEDFTRTQEQATAEFDQEEKITLSLREAFDGIQKNLNFGGEIFHVRIPPGTKQDTKLRIRGKGRFDSKTKQRGNLYLKVEISPDSVFQLEGENLVCEVQITAAQAASGVTVGVPTIDGSVNVQVPAGISSGKLLRLRGKGWPILEGGRGDQLVRILFEPSTESSEEKSTLPRKFAGVVGIDLGKINSRVAIMADGQPVMIPTKEGFCSTPSVVAYHRLGTHLLGQVAKRQAIMNPENSFSSIIRFIGCKYDEVSQEAQKVSYGVVQDTKGKIKINCPALAQQFTPEELLAQILAKLANDASYYLGESVTQAVIAVPASFNYIQRCAIKEAGHLAGLEVLRIINEPSAVSLAYGLDKQSNETILVFDLGGGTFDVSILEVGDSVFEVLATSGDTHLGGDDFDKKIVDYLASEFQKTEGIDLRKDKQALQRLTEAAEKAKIELSNITQADIYLPFINATRESPKHLDTTLTRGKFEELCADLIDRCRIPVENAVRDAKIDKSAIDEIVLVGGSTRIPAVKELVKRFLDKDPNQSVNPDEAVAVGAAIQGGVLAGEVKDILLLDVTSFSLGVETLGGVMTKIIPRNTTIPTKKSKTFSTAVDGQTNVEIHVLQGEYEMSSDNKSLGTFRLDGIPPAPHGVPQIEVTFDIDANDILNVTAKDKGTGKEISVNIEDQTNLLQNNYGSSRLAIAN